MKEVTPPLSQARIRSVSATDALITVEWLNRAKGTKARTDVLALRQKLEDLGAMMGSLRQQRQEAKTRNKGRRTPLSQEEISEAMRRAELYNEFRERHNSLNEDLSCYTFCPVMYYDLPSGVWRHNAIPRKPRGPVIEVTLQGITTQVSAATVVSALTRLAEHGELHKVRLCEWCKENFRVSERECDRFCSKQCSDADYQARPEFKLRRQRIQKNYRERENRNAAKELAQWKARS